MSLAQLEDRYRINGLTYLLSDNKSVDSLKEFKMGVESISVYVSVAYTDWENTYRQYISKIDYKNKIVLAGDLKVHNDVLVKLEHELNVNRGTFYAIPMVNNLYGIFKSVSAEDKTKLKLVSGSNNTFVLPDNDGSIKNLLWIDYNSREDIDRNYGQRRFTHSFIGEIYGAYAIGLTPVHRVVNDSKIYNDSNMFFYPIKYNFNNNTHYYDADGSLTHEDDIIFKVKPAIYKNASYFKGNVKPFFTYSDINSLVEHENYVANDMGGSDTDLFRTRSMWTGVMGGCTIEVGSDARVGFVFELSEQYSEDLSDLDSQDTAIIRDVQFVHPRLIDRFPAIVTIPHHSLYDWS